MRRAAEEAGRDPRRYASTPRWSPPPTCPNAKNSRSSARAPSRTSRFPSFGETLAGANGWDLAALDKLRSHPDLVGIRGSADNVLTRDQLRDVSLSLPPEWLTGRRGRRGRECAARWQEYLDAGADELVLHGSTPELLGPSVAHFTEPSKGAE